MESQNVQEIIEGYYCGSQAQELVMTPAQLESIQNAIQNLEFRNTLADDVVEAGNTENNAIYQEQITILEREPGNNVCFLDPSPGYVLKTITACQTKVFINICSNRLICKPDFEFGNGTGSEDKDERVWTIPHAQSPPRDDLDKSGQKCKVFDVIFNPIALDLGAKNLLIGNKLEKTALDAVEQGFGLLLDRVNLKKPKLSYKGPKTPVVVKIDSKPPGVIDPTVIGHENRASKSKTCSTPCSEIKSPVNQLRNWTIPKYTFKSGSRVDLQQYASDHPNSKDVLKVIPCASAPEYLNLLIELPLLSSGSVGLRADVIEDGRAFELFTNPKTSSALYHLKLSLPHLVDPDSAKATFDKDKRNLSVVMKVANNNIASPQEPQVKSLEREEEKGDETEEIYVETFEDSPSPHGKPLVSILCRTESSDNNSDELTSSNLSTSIGSLSKKTVRFSDEIQRKVYRSNSSILGQRKKNQRKSKNKRKSRERLNSFESANSSEVDEHELESADQKESGFGTKSQPRPILGGQRRQRFSSGDSLGSEASSFDDHDDSDYNHEPDLVSPQSPKTIQETIHELNCDN